MLNKLEGFLRQHSMLNRGDTVICAISGGADSVALLYAMHLLSSKLGVSVVAAHFNHRLRGEESDRDENFVSDFCRRLGIPLVVGSGQVLPGKKGLEAAARDARYAFLRTIPGKIATAHTADDNTETVLMHLIRGTGLKGMGGIAPVNGRIIRPFLGITRQEVLSFLAEHSLSYVDDSSNAEDRFLRNRLRHRVIPLLKEENPSLAENISAMALRLRDDEAALCAQLSDKELPGVDELRNMPAAIRRRFLTRFLENRGVTEPDAHHIELAESLVFSERPSAKAVFPGGITIGRDYDRLELLQNQATVSPVELKCPGCVEMPTLNLRIHCAPAEQLRNTPDCFTVLVSGKITVRNRNPGDRIGFPGGHKSIKKLFIDRKIPAGIRDTIPVIADDNGILGVYGVGANYDRLANDLPAVEICFERTDR